MALNRQTKPQAEYPVSPHVSPEADGPESTRRGHLRSRHQMAQIDPKRSFIGFERLRANEHGSC
jgi:hypothetical protein